MLLEAIILIHGERMAKNRTVAAIYHILTGKKSVQSMQDVHIYGLEMFYGIYPTLSKSAYQQYIQKLQTDQFLKINETDGFRITEDGRRWLREQNVKTTLAGLNGLAYHKMANVFVKRLWLMIQTVTNSMMENDRYIPIVNDRDIQVWVKYYYQTIKSDQVIFRKRLYTELESALQQLSADEAAMFVDRLTGYSTYGKSSQQLAETYQLNLTDVPIVWMRLIHQLLAFIQKQAKNYPTLNVFIDKQTEQTFITQSAKKTFQLLTKGIELKKIASIRHLKINTIYDHIVEMALVVPGFSIKPYVDDLTHEAIRQTVEQVGRYSLKKIKEVVGDEISYFQIKLVMTTINAEQGDRQNEK